MKAAALFIALSLALPGAAGCGDDSGSGGCTNFASGSLTDSASVPSRRDTAFGITLEFDEVAGDELEMSFVCRSNGEVLFSGSVDQNPGFGFQVDVDGEPYRIEFAWVPAEGAGIDFSVAVMGL